MDTSPLFLTQATLGYPKEMVKTAVTKLGRDVGKWEQEIVSAFHENHPYLQNEKLAYRLNKTDAEAGTAVGQILVDDKAAVPVIVDNFKLQPFDLFMHDGKLRPLTKSAFLDIIQSTGIGTSVEPGIGEVSDVSIFNVTQPPFSGKYSYAGSLTFTEDQLQRALESMGPQGLEFALQSNLAFKKVASAYLAAAKKELPDTAEKVAYTIEPLEFDGYVPVDSGGAYEVLAGGINKISGIIFDKVLSLSWDTVLPEKLFCSFEGGKIALAESMGGKPAQSAPGTGFADDPRNPGVGFFWTDKLGQFIATTPMRIHYTGKLDNGLPFIKAAELAPDGKVLTIRPSNSYKSLMIDGGTIYMGEGWNWKSCGETVKVASAEAANQAAWPNCAEIRHRDGRWTLHGASFDDLIQEGEKTEDFLAKVGSRYGEEMTLRLMKDAEETGVSFFKVTESAPVEKRASGLSPVNLTREAAFIIPLEGPQFAKLGIEVKKDEAENSVDSVLGLNFLNDQNMPKFIEGLDAMEDTMGVLSKLLLAARLGLKVDQSPIRTALFALDDVVRQLQQMKSTSSGAAD